jgi:hypothetical protein
VATEYLVRSLLVTLDRAYAVTVRHRFRERLFPSAFTYFAVNV